MKKQQLLLYLIFNFGLIYSQISNKDTTYYPLGNIKQVRYEKGERYSSEIRYFKNSQNPLDQNLPVIDTVFNNDYANKNKWTYYDGSVRIFLHGKSNIWIGKSTKYGSNKDSAYLRMKGVYHYLFPDLNSLRLTLSYNNDTNITFLSIEKYDFSRKGNFHKDQFIINRYDPQSGVRFNSSEESSLYNCGDLGVIEMFFDKTNLLKKMIFYSDKKGNATVYEFYANFFCKKYYHLFNGVECGEFFEYFENGNVKSVGRYKINNTFSSEKTGVWEYFNRDGKKIK
jgi:antitoxin component YwqK of YwqJK toxin-antitoxin module